MRAASLGDPRTTAWAWIIVAVTHLCLAAPLVAAQPAGPDDCAPPAAAEIPRVASAEGAPVALRLVLAPCAIGRYAEVRAWIGDEDRHASRIWDGHAWQAGSRYVSIAGLPTTTDAHILPVKADPTATHAHLLGSDTGQLWIRLRGTTTTQPLAVGEVTWIDGPGTPHWTDDTAWIAVRDETGDLVASAPTGFDRHGRPLPNGFGAVVLPHGWDPQGAAPPLRAGDVHLIGMAPHATTGGPDLIQLAIRTTQPLDLRGLRLDDGEGSITFTEGQADGGARLVVLDPALPAALADARDGTRWTWSDNTSTGLIRHGPFALAGDGDDLRLVYGDVVLDAFRYGDGPAVEGWTGDAIEAASIEGRWYQRIDHGAEASAWLEPRIRRILQEDRAAPWFDAEGPARAFTCPERCWHEVAERVDGATTTLDVNLYELSLDHMVTALTDAAGRGVDVRLLLHPRPVAAAEHEMARTAGIVAHLRDAGVDVRIHNGARFDVDHAKYLVADGVWTVVLSENANPRGWAPHGTGNRGWGIAVHDAALGAWMTTLFSDDHNHPVDTISADGPTFSDDPTPYLPDPYLVAPPPAADAFVVEGPVRVRPVLAPDHLGDPRTSPLVDAILHAQTSIWTQQLNLPLDWKRPGYATDSPLVAGLVAAAERGATVHGVLAAAFEDGDVFTDGNDRTAAVLTAHHPLIDVRLGDLPDGIVHNKGWILDDLVVVGSANGNLASQAHNREVTLFIDDARIAGFYRDALAADWETADLAPAPPGQGTRDSLIVLPGPSLVFTLILLVLAARVRPRPLFHVERPRRSARP